ncbi:MAG: AAA family ATPase [Abditibacteriaceae bacterium]
MNKAEPNLATGCTEMNGSLITPEKLANRHRYKLQVVKGKREWHGANPMDDGADDDGYILFDAGNSWDRNLDKKYPPKDTAKLFGIDPMDYEPHAKYVRNCSTSTPKVPSASFKPSKVKKTSTKARRKPTTTDHYYLKDGELNNLVRRIDNPVDKPDGKDFFQWQSLTIHNMNNAEYILYNYDDVKDARVVFVVEGEKCADALNKLLKELGLYGEYVATCFPMGTSGAKHWKNPDAVKILTGKDCVILTDNDAPGRNLGKKIKEAITGIALRIGIVELPNLPAKGDVVDYFNNGGTLDTLLQMSREALNQEPAERFRFYSMEEILAMPRIKSVVYNILFEQTVSILCANSGAYKSFIAMDWAFHVCTGTAWQGRDVKQGGVVYVAAEGFHTIGDRFLGWKLRNGNFSSKNFYVLKEPINTADPSLTNELIKRIVAFNPTLVILDTLSQCAAGMNENDNGAMALFINGMRRIAETTGAHVMALHHNAKGSDILRGAGSLKDNVDTLICLERPKNDITHIVNMRFEKQRGEPHGPLVLQGTEVELSILDEKGNPIKTLVFDELEGVTPAHKVDSGSQRSNKTQDAIMAVFDDVWNQNSEQHGGVKAGIWMNKTVVKKDGEQGDVCSKSTFFNYRNKLISEGVIEQVGMCEGSPIFARVNHSPLSPICPNRTSETVDSTVQFVQQPLRVGLTGLLDSEKDQSARTNQTNGHKVDSEPNKAPQEVTIQ